MYFTKVELHNFGIYKGTHEMCLTNQIGNRNITLVGGLNGRGIQGLNYTLNGDQNYCLPSTINISFHGVDAEGIFLAVKEDYAFSNGSACNSGSHAPSYVLTAMGLDEARISEAVRISWNHNTVVDFSALVDYIKSIT